MAYEVRAKRPKYPPIDWLLAAILERKKVMKLEWADIAAAANMSPDSLRSLVAKKPPEEWPKDTRENVCRYLGINAKMVVFGSPDDVRRNGI